MTSHDTDTSGCGFTLVMMLVLVVSAWLGETYAQVTGAGQRQAARPFADDEGTP